MQKRSRLRNLVEYVLAVLVLKSLQWSPLGTANALGRYYARLLDRAVPRLRHVAERNLVMALPELSAAERTAIIDGVFCSIARLLVSLARFPSLGVHNLDSWIRIEGAEHIEAALRRGHGVLFATAHLGNWELSAFAHGLVSGPMSILVRPLDNPLIDRLVERRRDLCGNRIIFKKDFARSILKALAANDKVGILIDQNASLDSGVFVDFFGIPACAGTGFAKIAAHSRAAVIPAYALWNEEEGRYVLRFNPPIEITGDAARDTARLHAGLEAAIRANPDQWLWIHRRWKTRPPGEPSLYDD
jgi:KDO2-lipid IV(A) lauroyltransferase